MFFALVKLVAWRGDGPREAKQGPQAPCFVKRHTTLYSAAYACHISAPRVVTNLKLKAASGQVKPLFASIACYEDELQFWNVRRGPEF